MPEQSDNRGPGNQETGTQGDSAGNGKERITLVLTLPEYRELSKALQQITLAGVRLFTQQHPNYTILKGLFSSMLDQEARREVERMQAAIRETQSGGTSDRRIRVDGSAQASGNQEQISTSEPATSQQSNQKTNQKTNPEPEVELVPRDAGGGDQRQSQPARGAKRKTPARTAKKTASKRGRRRGR